MIDTRTANRGLNQSVANILNVIRLKYSDSTSSSGTVIWISLHGQKLHSVFESCRCESSFFPISFGGLEHHDQVRWGRTEGVITGDHRPRVEEGLRLKEQFTLFCSQLNFSRQALLSNDWTYTQGHALAVTLSKHTHTDTRMHTPHLLIVETAADPLALTRGEEFPAFNGQKCVNLWFFTIGRRQMDSFTLSLFSARARGSVSRRRGYPPLIKGGGWELEGLLDRWTAFTKEPGIFEPRLWSIFN